MSTKNITKEEMGHEKQYTKQDDEVRMLRDVLKSKSQALSVLEYDYETERLRVSPNSGSDRKRVRRLKNEAEQEEIRAYLLRMMSDVRRRVEKVCEKSSEELSEKKEWPNTMSLVRRIEQFIDGYEAVHVKSEKNEEWLPNLLRR